MRLMAIALGLLSCVAGGASAGTLDRIRHDGVVRCGSAIRPGLAFPAIDHSWHGLHVDLCHAIAAAVIGADGRVEFNGYALPADFGRIRSGADDVAFLTASEMFANDLFGAVVPGPSVFAQSTAVMVWETSPIRHVGELAGTMVCVEPGTGPERNLMEYAARHDWKINVSPWMEVEEMMDAFDVGRCPAMAGEVTALAALRLSSAQAGHKARILPEPLAIAPVLASVPASDPAWAAVVTWTIETVMWASRPAANKDAQALPIPGAALGLIGDWQARATAAAGSYAAMYQLSLGHDSPLDLPEGANADWRDGGLRITPTVE